jgi:tetratricopeptide (TPR) repeat protein
VTPTDTAPRESVKLALLPLETEADSAALAAGVSQAAAARIEQLRGGRRLRLEVIPLAQTLRANVGTATTAQTRFGATHVVRGTLRREESGIVLHAFVGDTRTGGNTGEREFRYAPGELRYASTALAGMVSAALRLPRAAGGGVSEAAKEDYAAGLAHTRRISTIDKALPLLQRAVQADPDSPLTWAGLAEAQWFKYFVTQDRAWLDRTAESVRQAQNRDPDAAAVHRIAGLLRANAGKYDEAVAEYSRAIELEPANGDGYRRLGQAYDSSNRLDQALTAFRKAVELEPNDFRQYVALGTYYVHRGDPAEATRQFEKGVQLAPDEPDAHYALGTAYSQVSRYVEAERELRAAIALGEAPRALNNLANVLMHQGKDREAIPVLTRGLERFPNRFLWWMNLGDAYRRTNLPGDSGRAYQRSLELAEKEMARNPRDGAIRARLAYLCARLGHRQRAESEVAQALELSPEAIDTRHAGLWTYEALGQREQALALLRSSSDQVLAQAVRRVDLADLHQDSRFKQLVDSRRIQKEPGR